jgi:hypothetical protein
MAGYHGLRWYEAALQLCDQPELHLNGTDLRPRKQVLKGIPPDHFHTAPDISAFTAQHCALGKIRLV